MSARARRRGRGVSGMAASLDSGTAAAEAAAAVAASAAHEVDDPRSSRVEADVGAVPRLTTAAVMRRAQEFQRGSFKKDRAQEEQEEERAERISGTLEADPPVTAGLSTPDR